jgi:outer membrane protein TolC
MKYRLDLSAFPGIMCVLSFAAILMLSACSRVLDRAQRRADRAGLDVIAEKQIAAFGSPDGFAIDPEPTTDTVRLLDSVARLDLADTAYTTPTYTLRLSDSLAIAIANNRDYQTTRERLFLQALALTGVRWEYVTIFAADATAEFTRERTEDEEGNSSIRETGLRGFGASVSRQLVSGARLSLAYTHEFVRLFTSGDDPGVANGLAFRLVQPLLRGAGSLEAREGLRQSERDMLYGVRDFDRFQRAFAIEVVARYYNLLRSLDRMDNARNNLKGVNDNLTLLDIQFRNNLRSQLDVDQARQKVFDADAILIDAQSAYQAQLDEFKIFLGIDLNYDVGPDRGELDELTQQGMVRPDITLADAIGIGLAERPELLNARDRVTDAQRHVRIAERNFLPDLDARFDWATTDQRDDGLGLAFRNRRATYGLDLILPLDWTPRRNFYRAALIDQARARRAIELLHDSLTAEIRDAWRELDRLERRYLIARQSRDLALRRVEGTQLGLASGVYTAREMADVQDELLNAQNALTAVLIDFTLQRLRFWHTIGRLSISDTAKPEQ